MRWLISFFVSIVLSCGMYNQSHLSIDGYINWSTGHDSATVQLEPAGDNIPLRKSGAKTVANVKFKIVRYGEVSFTISSFATEEAPGVDLRKSRFIVITYQANHELVLQLRQTGQHGGVHNHVILPASAQYRKYKVLFTSFKGGKKPLDLSNVSKFNFAFLANNKADGFAELYVKAIRIDRYKPN